MTGLPAAFGVRVCMLSDWIVGTGEGRVGAVDATVRRDADGLPFVPAKTLTGIWRDACEQVAGWLAGPGGPGQAGGPWQDWTDWIFGSQPDVGSDRTRQAHRPPQPAALSLSPARLPLPVRRACRTHPALRAAAVLLRPGVAIDGETGVARDRMLRLEERARPGVLDAWAEFALPGGGDLPAAAELLLRAGAAAVDGLGGKRNRGAGRCWLLLPGMTGPRGDAPAPAALRPADRRLAELAANLALLDDPGSPPTAGNQEERPTVPRPVTPKSAQNGPVPVTAVAPRTVYRVTLEVVTPLVAQHRVLGNVVLSRDCLPGSALLPAILPRLDQRVGHRDLVVGDARPAAIADGATIPGLPAPMVWYRPKDRHRTDLVNAAERRPGPAERRKAMRAGHIVPAGAGAGTSAAAGVGADAGNWCLLTPRMTVSAHAVVDDDAGRPTSDRGGVFSYVGLAPGTILASDVVLPAAVQLKLAAGDRLRLGRSRKDDFGEVLVRAVDTVPATAAGPITAGATVRVWCVSDVLLRDALGAPDPSPRALANELARRLEVPVRVVEPTAGGAVVQAQRAARRESFHTRWGRPRPSLTGLAGGSVITLRIDGAVPADTLAAVQRDGIGERTAEGFGQVRFDAPEVWAADPELVSLPVTALPDVAMPDMARADMARADMARADMARADMAPAGDGTKVAGLPPAPTTLERAAVQAEIGRRVAAAVVGRVEEIVPGARQVTSRAQWGSLRQQLPRLSTPAGRDAVGRWFDQTGKVRQRRAAWGQPALDVLRHLVTDETAVWAALGLDGAALETFVLAPGRAAAVRASLRDHAVSALITEISRDAVRQLQAGSAAREVSR
jgi:CRISPR-associated protein Csx10